MSAGYVLDDTVIHAYASGDPTVSNLIAALDDRAIRIAVPFLALSSSLIGLTEDQRAQVNGIIDNLDVVQISPLTTTDDANELADVAAAGAQHIDLPSAHIVAVARHLDWEIITADRSRWTSVERCLPFPVNLVECLHPDASTTR